MEQELVLPKEFLQRMQKMLGEEYQEFLNSFYQEKYHALRINSLKGDAEKFFRKSPFSVTPVSWAKNGYYYSSKDQPGKHPYHEAGVYYIQEPSAMAPAEFLGAMPGEHILDLCAAPGGKSTQIAADMKGKGILVCNEIHPARAKILSENIERMAVRNAIVTNESPQRLAEVFPNYFDRILVDAPCSGEGMFRKNPQACKEWSIKNVELCAVRQDEILEEAAKMLRLGGRLVYSTCTFSSLENEGSIWRFLKKHPEFLIVSMDKAVGMTEGIFFPSEIAFQEEVSDSLLRSICKNTVRLLPHKLHGEGHYTAVLQKTGENVKGKQAFCVNGIEKGITLKECEGFFDFSKEYIRGTFEGKYLKFGQQLYFVPEEMPSMKGLKVLRPGLHLGTLKKNRFEPSHSLALALQPEDVSYVYSLSAEDSTAAAYLNGETFFAEGEKGWYLISVDGYSLGWGKLAGGTMKNHYPKGLRK